MKNPLSNLDGYQIVLASASPRRRELLAKLDIPFCVATAIDVDESYPASTPTELIPEHIAMQKSHAYAEILPEATICITADTIVVAPDGAVMGKPRSADDARCMLRRLAGATHRVVTGVVVNRTASPLHDATVDAFHAVSDVVFAELSDDEIDYYVEHYRPMDKAGAYGIQEWIGAAAIKEIRGSFYNVMGLPIHRLYALLRSL